MPKLCGWPGLAHTANFSAETRCEPTPSLEDAIRSTMLETKGSFPFRPKVLLEVFRQKHLTDSGSNLHTAADTQHPESVMIL